MYQIVITEDQRQTLVLALDTVITDGVLIDAEISPAINLRDDLDTIVQMAQAPDGNTYAYDLTGA